MADAAQDTTAVTEWMQETYTKKDFFDPYQESFTPLLSDLEECPDEPVKGKQWNVPLYMATGWNVRTGAEGGPQAEVESDSVVQGKVRAHEFKGTVKLTELLERVGTSDAHFNGGALDHQMKQRTMEMSKLMQIHFWGFGDGRLGVVDEAVVAGTVIKLRLPKAWTATRRNMRIEVRTTAGVLEGTNPLKILKVDRKPVGISGAGAFNTFAGQITVDLATTVSAGSVIYSKGDYTYAPNGIEGLVTDNTVQNTFLTLNRTTHAPDLNAQRDHANGVPRPVSQEILRSMSDSIYFVGREIDSIRCNAGQINKVASLSVNNLRYNVVSGGYPKYIQGHREGDLLFAYDRVTATFKKDPQCPLRRIYFLSFRDSFNKHTSAELGFLRRGGDILMPVVSSGGGGYDYSLQARLYAAKNISNYFPGGNGVIEDLEDTLAGE
jgi:hypothetical protein